MRLQQGLVQTQHRLCKHPDGQINQAQFESSELGEQVQEQIVGQRHIVHAVPTIGCQLFLWEIGTPQVDGVHHLSALDPQFVVRRQFRQTVADLCPVDSPCHAQGVSDCLGLDAVVPVQDCHVEQSVVRQRHAVAPIELHQPLFCFCVGSGEPFRFTIVDLHSNTDHLKARVTDIFLRGLRLEAKVGAGVVGLKVYC